MFPSLRRALLGHRIRSPYSQRSDFVFPSLVGTGLNHRNVAQRGLEAAATNAGINRPGTPRITFHSLRHTFASMLIAQDTNVVFVSQQLGHKNPAITLKTYAHLFEAQDKPTGCANVWKTPSGTYW